MIRKKRKIGVEKKTPRVRKVWCIKEKNTRIGKG